MQALNGDLSTGKLQEKNLTNSIIAMHATITFCRSYNDESEVRWLVSPNIGERNQYHKNNVTSAGFLQRVRIARNAERCTS